MNSEAAKQTLLRRMDFLWGTILPIAMLEEAFGLAWPTPEMQAALADLCREHGLTYEINPPLILLKPRRPARCPRPPSSA